MYILYTLYQKTTGFDVEFATSNQRGQEIKNTASKKLGSNTGRKQRKPQDDN